MGDNFCSSCSAEFVSDIRICYLCHSGLKRKLDNKQSDIIGCLDCIRILRTKVEDLKKKNEALEKAIEDEHEYRNNFTCNECGNKQAMDHYCSQCGNSVTGQQ